MLEKLTADSFEDHLESIFLLDIDTNTPLALKLSEVTRYTNPAFQNDKGIREPFSIIFIGPAQPILPQSSYVLKHDQMGVIDGIFLVPVGKDDQGCYYQAVFN
ncbi:MAG: hypothetical protein JSV61_10390 [Anaerolineales bacterium]|nr:MAG: hypothetical protein JSV61_10390 [Anaerolineales bacterium]